MSGESLLIFLIVGLVAGWLAGVLVRGYGLGLLGNMVVGVLGAFIGSWLLPRIGVGSLTGTPIVDSIIVATIGAVVLLVLIGLVRRAPV